MWDIIFVGVVLSVVSQDLWALFLSHFCTSVTIPSTDETYQWLTYWLSSSSCPYGKNCQNLKSLVRRGSDPTSLWDAWSSPKLTFVPGIGLHLFRYKGRMIAMRYYLERSAKTDQIREELTLVTFGNGRMFLTDLLQEAMKLYEEAEPANVFIFYLAPSPDHWLLQSKKLGRSLDSVILPKSIKQSILDDVDTFNQSESWYKLHGIPYRRGYLLFGPPGTGKTSFILALAAKLKRVVCVVTLSDSNLSDSALIESFNMAPNHAIIVFEDVDSALLSASRERNHNNRVTLSGLLNCIDGIGTREKNIIIFTSNHPEKLSPALLRPGRIDKKYCFGLASSEQIGLLFEQFFPEAPKQKEQFISLVKEDTYSVAELQGLFVAHRCADELVSALPELLAAILEQRLQVNAPAAKEATQDEEEVEDECDHSDQEE